MDPDVDEHSVMTYLSQFPKAKLKPGAPLRPKQLFPNKVKAYGPGGCLRTSTQFRRVHELIIHAAPRSLAFRQARIDCRPATGAAECLTAPCVIAGIEPHGNKVLQPAVFTVDTLEAGSGEVLVYVEDPEGHTEEVHHVHTTEPVSQVK